MVLKKLGYNRVGPGLDYSSGASLLGLKVGQKDNVRARAVVDP